MNAGKTERMEQIDNDAKCYTVQIQRIAKGGFGTVRHLVYDGNSNMVVKDIALQSKDDEDHFGKEVFLLNQVCHHPAIVSLLGSSRSYLFGCQYGSIYMEYAIGGDLLDLVQTKGPCCESTSVRSDIYLHGH